MTSTPAWLPMCFVQWSIVHRQTAERRQQTRKRRATVTTGPDFAERHYRRHARRMPGTLPGRWVLPDASAPFYLGRLVACTPSYDAEPLDTPPVRRRRFVPTVQSVFLCWTHTRYLRTYLHV